MINKTNLSVKDKEKLPNIVKRIKIKRQTKLICTLDEKWNNYDSLSKILRLGVDGIEIYSELKDEIKKDLVAKIKTYAKENNQYIPIILNLSYYRIYISQINKKDENEIGIFQNQFVYLMNNNSNYEKIEKHIINRENERILRELSEEFEQLENEKNKEYLLENQNENSDILCERLSNDRNKMNNLKSEMTILFTEPLLNFSRFIKNDVIHINYGEVSLKVESIEEDYIKCIALNSGNISKFNSLSVEGKDHFGHFLLNTDPKKLNYEIEVAQNLGVEFVVISIIDDPVKEINYINLIRKNHPNPFNLIIRIDNPKSIHKIDEYINLADAIYFSRSDLNLKDSLSKICFYQKSIVSKCGYLGVPVIVAGTFLDTMRTLPNPIRAEISDLYNTILQGIDCLLLTSEIIYGSYPYEVVETINEICSSCEKRVDYSNLFLEILYKTQKPMKIVEAVASSTVKTSFNLQTPFIVCVTEKGTASQMVAKYRPYCPVISITSKSSIAHALAIYRGIFSIIYDDTSNTDAVISYSNDFLLNSKLVTSKNNIVLLSGVNEKKNGTTDQMRVITLL